jgi:hypothetical protein
MNLASFRPGRGPGISEPARGQIYLTNLCMENLFHNKVDLLFAMAYCKNLPVHAFPGTTEWLGFIDDFN